MSRAGFFASAHVPQGGGGIAVDFQEVRASSPNTYAHTFSNVAIGTPSATRRVVVACAYRGAYPVASVTIGGVSAAMDAASTAGGNQAEIWSAVVPSGTTATIEVTLSMGSTSPTGAGIGVWALSGGAAAATAVMSPVNQATVNMTVATQAGDVCIGVVSTRTTTAPPGVAWNAATSRYDAAWDGAPRTHSGADLIASGSSTDMGSVIGNFTTESGACAVAYR